MARDIPARAAAGVGEEGVRAGDVFLRPIGVDFVLNLVVFLGDGQDTRAMDGAIRKTEFGGDNAQLVPDKIGNIKKKEQAEQRQGEALEE